MTREIQTFRTEDFIDKIKVRIQSAFVELIPEEQWNILVKKEIDDWLYPKQRGYRQDSVSDFGITVQSVLNEYTKEAVKKILSEEYSEFGYDENNRKIINKRIEGMIKENSGDILLSILGNAIQHTIHSMVGSGALRR